LRHRRRLRRRSRGCFRGGSGPPAYDFNPHRGSALGVHFYVFRCAFGYVYEPVRSFGNAVIDGNDYLFVVLQICYPHTGTKGQIRVRSGKPSGIGFRPGAFSFLRLSGKRHNAYKSKKDYRGNPFHHVPALP
jgi:hypothetical protein